MYFVYVNIDRLLVVQIADVAYKLITVIDEDLIWHLPTFV